MEATKLDGPRYTHIAAVDLERAMSVRPGLIKKAVSTA
jgi:hypothetical protein